MIMKDETRVTLAFGSFFVGVEFFI